MIRALSRFALVALATLALAGCFQPLHTPTLGASGPVLASIEVMPVDGHLGHQVKSELDFLLSNGNPPEKGEFRLTIQPKGRVGSVIVDVATARPQIMNYFVDANFTLVEIKTGRLVTSGTAQVSASFDRTQQRFANVRALRDAEIRGAKMLAEQVRARIIPALTAKSG